MNLKVWVTGCNSLKNDISHVSWSGSVNTKIMKLENRVSGWPVLVVLKDLIIFFSHRYQEKEERHLGDPKLQSTISLALIPQCQMLVSRFVLPLPSKNGLISALGKLTRQLWYTCTYWQLANDLVLLSLFKLSSLDKITFQLKALVCIWSAYTNFISIIFGAAGSPSGNTLTPVGTCRYDSSLGD